MKPNEQPACLRVVLPCSGTNLTLIVILHLGYSLAVEIRKMGGKARCLKTPDRIIVESTGVSLAQMQPYIDGIGHMKGATLKVAFEERASPEVDLDSPGVIFGEFAAERLTRKFLFGLPDGAILVGNSSVNGMPEFMALLGGKEDRSRIWQRAVNSGAAQRICDVYWNPDDVREIHGFDPDMWNEAHDDGDMFPPSSRM